MKQAQLRATLICVAIGITPILNATLAKAAAIREIKGTTRSLIAIQTALGFSTILEFQSKPLSAVLGDQDGFKLEYVANSITLKPLIHGAKSNLFVFTESGRYNFSIQAGTPASVDYIVTIKSPDDTPQAVVAHAPLDSYRIVVINRKTSARGFTLQVNRLKLNRELNNPRAASLIEFEISSQNSYSFQASSMGVKQNGKFINAESIYLDQLVIQPSSPVHGVIAVLNQEWRQSTPISIVFAFSTTDAKTRKTKTSRLEVFVNPAPKPVIKKGAKNGEVELFPKIHH